MQKTKDNLSTRKINTIRNLFYGLGAYGMNIILSFVNRSVFIYFLSVEYLGVNGLFSNILPILSLAELGSGGAFVSLLYKPLAVNDKKSIAFLMKAFNKVYILVGCVIGLVGICFTPFLNFFTPGSNLPHLEIIYLLFLANSVITYFYADKRALISADQKDYLVTKYSQVAIVIQYLLQIFILFLTHNYIVYLLIQILCAFGQNIYIKKKVEEIYPFLQDHVLELTTKIKQDIIQKMKGSFCEHLGEIIASGTDGLVISHFLGLIVLGIYSNYLLIIGVISKIFDILLRSVRASASNFIVVSKPEENYLLFRRINFIAFFILGICCTCLIVLFNPFINLWIGKKFIMETNLVILAVIIFFLGWHGLKYPLYIYRTARGLYYRDRYVSLLEGIGNVALSVIMVQQMGLAGVFWGTIISSLFTTISASYLIFHYIFERTVLDYWRIMFKYLVIFTLICWGVNFLTNFIPHSTITGFVLMTGVCLFLTCFLYVLAFWNTNEEQYYIVQFRLILNKFNFGNEER